MKKILLIGLSVLAIGSMNAVAADKSSTEIENTDVVASGTYRGTAMRVDQDEKEIYVKTDDGKILELYLKDDTKIMKGGENVEFSKVEKGQSLQVKVEKIGNHLKPLEVVILSEKSSK